MSACSTATFKLAKRIVKMLEPITYNEYSVKNSFEFVKNLSNHPVLKDSVMVSFDVESLFTSIPVNQTIDIIIELLFSTPQTKIEDLNAEQFKRLLLVVTNNTYFIFNGKLYQQIDGMAKGSPLGPVFANIFMNYLENKFLSLCPANFKPKYYRRYVDDTYTFFDNIDQANNFLNFINNFHPNIKFTMDVEKNKQLSFLDVLVNRDNDFKFTIFRKSTYTGLTINFFSFCPLLYKINAFKTLLFRSYSLCSNYNLLHNEILFLHSLCRKNNFPISLLQNLTKKFLNNVFSPPKPLHTVPKKIIFISLPYFGIKSEKMKNELYKFLSSFFPFANFKIVLTNDYNIGSLFHFKDKFNDLLSARIIYKFQCPICKNGQYIGSTIRNLYIRISEHCGVSFRTERPLSRPNFSAVRSHCEEIHGMQPKPENFSIIKKVNDEINLRIVESMLIKKFKPSLNNMLSCHPLYVF